MPPAENNAESRLRIGVVIPFYNGHEFVSNLIASIDEASIGLDCTVFIVDNSPKQSLIEYENVSNLEIQVIKAKAGIGYGKACNLGIQKCKDFTMDYAIIVNQDGFVSSGIIRALITPFKMNNQILITAPIIRTYDEKQVEDFFIKYYLTQIPSFVSDLLTGNQKDYYELEKVSGACFAFNLRSQLYNYPYFFDPLFHMYYEDEDLCRRIRTINGKIVMVCRDAIYYHKHSHTTNVDNRSSIESNKLVSEKILRLKNLNKRFAKALYGILVSYVSNLVYNIFRGEFRKAFQSSSSMASIMYLIRRIYRNRRTDSIVAGKQQHIRSELQIKEVLPN